MEFENLAVKIFSEICCNGCFCQSDNDHKKRPGTVETESGLILNDITNAYR